MLYYICIGEISLPVQVRLLRVLQEGTIRRVGAAQEIPIDVRVIAATHRNPNFFMSGQTWSLLNPG